MKFEYSKKPSEFDGAIACGRYQSRVRIAMVKLELTKLLIDAVDAGAKVHEVAAALHDALGDALRKWDR